MTNVFRKALEKKQNEDANSKPGDRIVDDASTPWSPKSFEQVTLYLNEYLFRVTIPTQLSRDIDDVRLFGTRHTGVSYIDNSVYDEWHNCDIPITKIADYHHRGIPIKANDQTELDKMYILINDYLVYWANCLQSQYNISEAPFEFLIVLDDLASHIFNIAKYQYDKLLPVSSGVRRILGNGNSLSLFNKSALDNVTETQHLSMADLFKRYSPLVARQSYER